MEETKRTILYNINGALQSFKLYPSGHPARRSISVKTFNLLLEVLEEQENLFISFANEVLVIDNDPIVDVEEVSKDLILNLQEKSIEAVVFNRGLQDHEFMSFLEILYDDRPLMGNELLQEISDKGIVHISVKSIAIDERSPTEVYEGAVEAVVNAMNEIRMGKVPRSKPIIDIVDEMSTSVFKDPNAIFGLTMIKNYDNYLHNHSVNVSILALELGKHMGLDEKQLRSVGIGGLLHDLGKTGVSEDIIRKPGGLSTSEWEKIKEHPVIGSEISSQMDGLDPIVGKVILEHHIRYDHTGYPETESTIHPLSLYITIADAYDAMTTLRVYQKPRSPVEALKLMNKFSGKHFDPATLEAFETMIGLYPVGTLVRISTGELAVVTKSTEKYSETPVIKIINDRDGKKLKEPLEVDLSIDADGRALEEGEEREDGREIVTDVDPSVVDFNVGEFFRAEGLKVK